MAKWTGSQFGVSNKGVKNITGTDFNRVTTSGNTSATDSGKIGWSNSSATQDGQTSMGNSRATSGGTGSGNTYKA